jgi:hypothetical protein
MRDTHRNKALIHRWLAFGKTGFVRVAVIAVLIALALLVWAGPKAVRWFAIDGCLDSGGRWDYARNQCEH